MQFAGKWMELKIFTFSEIASERQMLWFKSEESSKSFMHLGSDFIMGALH